METKLALLLVSMLAGCSCFNTKPSDTVTNVPIVEHTVDAVKPNMPDRPNLFSTKLNESSTQDETLKAALKDLESYKTYSNQLEKILEVK